MRKYNIEIVLTFLSLRKEGSLVRFKIKVHFKFYYVQSHYGTLVRIRKPMWKAWPPINEIVSNQLILILEV